MRNLKLTVEYDGSAFAGWQLQNNARHPRTIQETLEKSLRLILREKIKIIGSGRTDAGVHALAQTANFKTYSDIPAQKLRMALNGLLPKDIVIIKIEEKDLGFHSRFDAKSKTYRYSILNRSYPGALLRDWVYFYPHSLDMRLMRRESRSLLGRHNFKSFCASGSGVSNTIRTIKRITIKRLPYQLSAFGTKPKDSSLIVIDIEADGFLYNMVRNIVGTLLEAGRGKLARGGIRRILLSRDRRLAGPTVPAKGLCLMKVKY